MRFSALLLAVCVYAVQLAATAPATLADAALDQASGGRVRLAEATGTLWSGAGKLQILDARRRTGSVKTLAWRLLPASLFHGRADVEFATDEDLFTVAVFPSHIEANDVRLTLPVAALGLIVPNIAPLEPTGELLLHAAHLSMSPGALRGSATLLWRSAGSALSPVSPLGDYEIDAQADGDSGKAVLKTVSGPLRLEGRGSWTPGRAPSLLVTARVEPRYREQMQPFLRLVAVDRGDGSFELNAR